MAMGICKACEEERDIYVKGVCLRCYSLISRRKLTHEEVRAYLSHPDYKPRRGGRKNGFILKEMKGQAKHRSSTPVGRKKLDYGERLPFAELVRLYAVEKMTLAEVSGKGGIPISTLRRKLNIEGVLRGCTESQLLAASLGRKSHAKGKTRVITQEWKDKIRDGRNAWAAENAAGTSLKPSGYKEHTRGKNKFRSVHRVLMEEYLGRKLTRKEVVHHIDGNKLNNSIENLMVMSLQEHSRHHALERIQRRKNV